MYILLAWHIAVLRSDRGWLSEPSNEWKRSRCIHYFYVVHGQWGRAGQEISDSDLSATILVREEGDKINIPSEVDNKFIFHHNV